jgi:hypothetical protein
MSSAMQALKMPFLSQLPEATIQLSLKRNAGMDSNKKVKK